LFRLSRGVTPGVPLEKSKEPTVEKSRRHLPAQQKAAIVRRHLVDEAPRFRGRRSFSAPVANSDQPRPAVRRLLARRIAGLQCSVRPSGLVARDWNPWRCTEKSLGWVAVAGGASSLARVRSLASERLDFARSRHVAVQRRLHCGRLHDVPWKDRSLRDKLAAMRNHLPPSSLVALLLLALAGCGGPLAYTADAYDASKVSSEQRRSVEAAESEAAEAARKSHETEEQVSVAEESLENAEQAVEHAEHAVALAKAQLGVEEVKDDGNERSNVAAAKTDVSRGERDLAVNEAEVVLAEQKLERSRSAAVEAKRAWLVALAKVEVAKSEAAGVESNEAKAHHSELTAQLAEAEADRAAAKEKLAAADQAVLEAQEGVNEAKAKD
jgi:predicted small lipoprotein YifL